MVKLFIKMHIPLVYGGTPTIEVYVEGQNKQIDADTIYYKEANEHIHDWTAESIAILEEKQ